MSAAVSGCAGDISATPSGSIVPGTPVHPRAVNVILWDYLFAPTPILLVPGETVRFNIVNGGQLEHEFVLGDQAVQNAYEQAEAAHQPALPGQTAPPFSLPPQLAGLRVVVASGHSASVLYRVPTHGAPPLLECHIPGHLAAGMIGAIEYVSGQAPASATP